MSEKQNKNDRRTKLIAAGAAVGLLIGGIAVAKQTHNDKQQSQPIYQPDISHTPPAGGEEVPDGMQAPVGTTINHVPHTNQIIVRYGTSPDGQTFPDKTLEAPLPKQK